MPRLKEAITRRYFVKEVIVYSQGKFLALVCNFIKKEDSLVGVLL